MFKRSYYSSGRCIKNNDINFNYLSTFSNYSQPDTEEVQKRKIELMMSKIMPSNELENFITDSENENLGLTIIKLNMDDKNINLICFNDKGIQLKYKKKKQKTEMLTTVES